MMTRDPWGLAQVWFVGARLSLPRELYILFLKIKRQNQEECWRAQLLQPPQIKTVQHHAQLSYHHGVKWINYRQ